MMIETQNNLFSIRRQCQILSVPRQRLYYQPCPMSEETLSVMDCIDRAYTARPVLGVAKMVEVIKRQMGLRVNPKRVRRLMRKMGLMAIYPKPRTSIPAAGQQKYPCLLGGLTIDRPDQVWCSDITYIRLRTGFMYLMAILDYFSRYVVSWSLSNSLDSLFCVDALGEALSRSRPQVFHSDQGKQYTSTKFIDTLNQSDIAISMSGKGRCFDNILVERLWRTVKYETIYLHEYADGHALLTGIEECFDDYNYCRLHESLDYQTPAEVYFGQPFDRCAAAFCSAAAANSDERAERPILDGRRSEQNAATLAKYGSLAW